MLIPLSELQKKYDLKINGVIAIGAHFLEEEFDYLLAGAKKIIAIEPCKEAFNYLENKFIPNPIIKLFNYALSDKTGKEKMFVSKDNEGQSNSLLSPKLHKVQHPNIVFDDYEEVEVKRLDDLIFERSEYNMISCDVQGNEGGVFRGGLETLKHIDIVYTEVNRAEVYENCIQIQELDLLLSDFVRVETKWIGNWGDALYLSKKIFKL